jgi:hypothetical protein
VILNHQTRQGLTPPKMKTGTEGSRAYFLFSKNQSGLSGLNGQIAVLGS